MANTDFKSVDEYIAAQPEPVRAVLEQIRAIIRKALPGADEVISYQLPTYKLNGTYVIYLAGYKQHYSLYPATDALVETLGDEIAPYLHGRGTLRFPLAKPVPVKLVTRIVKLRAKEAAASAQERSAKRR